MIKLYIDAQEVERTEEITWNISVSSEALSDPGKIREERYPVRFPMTGRNRRIMRHTEQLLSAHSFNHQEHAARVEADGATLLSGWAQLIRCLNDAQGGGWYEIEVVVPIPEWIQEITGKRMREIEWNYEKTLSAELIEESWEADTPIRYLPVWRDRYAAAEYEHEVAPLQILTYEDYHPFFQIKSLLEAMVAPSGYRIESEFLNGAFFRSLYISGYYPTKEVARLKNRMNFLAGKAVDVSTTADSFGNVYTVPGQPFSSVGNLVDTADPYEIIDGNRIVGAFNQGNCFRKAGSRVAFMPNGEVTLGFEYRFRFRSNYTIVSEERMEGFTEIRLEDGTVHAIGTPTPPENRRNNRKAGRYAVVIPGATVPYSEVLRVVYPDQSTEEFRVTRPEEIISINRDYSAITLERELPDGGMETREPWMLYEAQEYIEATQGVEVDVTLRSMPTLRKKNEACYFDLITFKGGKAGTPFTLLQGTTLRPIFYAHPVIGSTVTIRELFAHDAYQIKLFEGVAHLFNLRFYTDPQQKTIRIEPLFLFHTETGESDWSEKIDRSQPIVSEDAAQERYRVESYGYAPLDGSVTRWNQEHQQNYARGEMTMESFHTREGEQTHVNPLFAPTLDQTRGYAQARSASWIRVGNREEYLAGEDDGNLNFPAKIVRYMGMRSLPEGERWGWPANKPAYPLVMFHSKGEDSYTLCFDNFEGQLGLMNYYLPEYERLNRGKKLVLYLNLSPSEVEALRYPNSLGVDFRRKYLFTIRGEKIRCRLLEVVNYNAASAESTRCVFIQEP